MTEQIKLKKADKALAKRFVQNHIIGVILNSAHTDGKQVSASDAALISEAVNLHDVTALSEAVGQELAKVVDFKSLARVEKFLSDPENIKAMEAARHVSIVLQEELFSLVDDILKTPVEKSE